jgi:hypothetical protein
MIDNIKLKKKSYINIKLQTQHTIPWIIDENICQCSTKQKIGTEIKL